MWFSPDRIYNEDLQKMMSGTTANLEGSLMDFMETMFKETGRLRLYFDVQYIWDNVPDAKRKDQQYIRNMLDDMRGVTRIKEGSKYRMPFFVTADMKIKDSTIEKDIGEVIWPTKGKQCRPYEFNAEYFLSREEYEILKKKNREKEEGEEETKIEIQKNIEFKD